MERDAIIERLVADAPSSLRSLEAAVGPGVGAPETAARDEQSSVATSSCKYRLIHEDNVSALDDLQSQRLRFQLVYLDPPYNTGRLRGARRSFRDTCRTSWGGSIDQV